MPEMSVTKLVHLNYKIISEFLLYDPICITKIWTSIRHVVSIRSEKVDKSGIKKRKSLAPA